MNERHMLLEDLKTVKGIFRKKRMVRRYLRETAEWCVPGAWYIEGPYARHSDTTLPDELRHAIRGIRKRQLAREIVERILPPWRVHVHRTAPAKLASRCSIAYLSNGGNWKLFDLDNGAVWTRPIAPDRDMTVQIKALHRFGGYFNIPSWHTVHDAGRIWRFDQYIGGNSLAHCTEVERLEAVRVLLRQFAAFARKCASDPDPALTEAAMRTMLESAPGTLPARVVRQHAGELRRLGESLPLVPAHGDLNAHNVFRGRGEPWIIDWDGAGRLEPILYDVLYLIFVDIALGRDDLFRALMARRFDHEIEGVFSAAGRPLPECPRGLLLMHAYLVNFHQKKLAHQRDAEARNVDALWAPLRVHFAGLEA